VAIRWIRRPQPIAIGMHGFSGSGKTWLSALLMSELPAIRVRSDIERKRQLALTETASTQSGPGSGAYTTHARTEIYEVMMEIIGSLIEARFSVIADASFLMHTHRKLLAAMAQRKGVALVWIDASAGNDELIRRLEYRKALRNDASEAGPDVLEYQYRHADSLTAAELEHTVIVSTEQPIDPGAIIKSIKSVQ